jgi:hypothetical protein
MSWQLADALLMPCKCYSVYILVHFRVNTGTDPDPNLDPDRIRIQSESRVLMTQIEKYLQLKKNLYFFDQKLQSTGCGR